MDEQDLTDAPLGPYRVPGIVVADISDAPLWRIKTKPALGPRPWARSTACPTRSPRNNISVRTVRANWEDMLRPSPSDPAHGGATAPFEPPSVLRVLLRHQGYVVSKGGLLGTLHRTRALTFSRFTSPTCERNWDSWFTLSEGRGTSSGSDLTLILQPARRGGWQLTDRHLRWSTGVCPPRAGGWPADSGHPRKRVPTQTRAPDGLTLGDPVLGRQAPSGPGGGIREEAGQGVVAGIEVG